MTGLLLVAASGLAREVLATLRAGGEPSKVWVLDDDDACWGSSLDGVPILGGLEDCQQFDSASFVVCAGKGRTRKSIVERLSGLGVGEDRYGRVVHPSVDVPPGCSVGAGSILLAGVVLTADVTIGRHVVVMPHVTLTHDDLIEDYATICAGVSLGGSVRVGTGAYLGMNASVRERAVVGAGSTLGMAAALLTDLPAEETWIGVPAQPVPPLHLEKA